MVRRPVFTRRTHRAKIWRKLGVLSPLEKGRGPVDVNNRFPAFAAVIGAQQNTIITAGQAYQFMNRMLTDAFTILFPLRVDIRGLVLGHMRSM